MMIDHRLPESTGQSPELSEFTEHSSKPITPNPYSVPMSYYLRLPLVLDIMKICMDFGLYDAFHHPMFLN
jgi:hypothetical protein